jgi:hypothetical protein
VSFSADYFLRLFSLDFFLRLRFQDFLGGTRQTETRIVMRERR